MERKIRRRVLRRGARSRTLWHERRFLRRRGFMFGKVWRWAVRAIFFFPRASKVRGSRMCASQAAQFLLQKDGFSCRDAHAFNRYSSSQVTLCLAATGFPLVSIGFSIASSLQFPSFHESPVLVLFRFVADNSHARHAGFCLARLTAEHSNREARLSCRESLPVVWLCALMHPEKVLRTSRHIVRPDSEKTSRSCGRKPGQTP